MKVEMKSNVLEYLFGFVVNKRNCHIVWKNGMEEATIEKLIRYADLIDEIIEIENKVFFIMG